MSIRVRLTLWHAAVFFLSLVGFAVVVWIRTGQVIHRDIDTWLLRQSDGLEEFLKRETQGMGQAAVVEETREFSTGLPRGSGVQLLDLHGIVLFEKPNIALDSPSEQPSTVVSENAPVRAVARTVTVAGETFQVRLWRSVAEAQGALDEFRDVLLLMIPAFLVISVAGGWFLSRRALRPVDEITEAARRISIQNLSGTLTVPPHADEIQRLTVAWNEMLKRLDLSAKQLRQFTADASHELRSPVTVVRTTAELALRQDRSSPEYRAALQMIHEESVALTGVIESLLELTRADSGPVLSLLPLDVRAIVLELRSHAESMAAHSRVQLKLSVTKDPVFVMGDKGALRRALLALIENAIKFTPPSGQVRVTLSIRSGELLFEVEDNGIGIAKEDLTRIFDRFYQVDRSRSGGGVGLGLSMAHWIAKEHGGQIEVESEIAHGTIFRLILPLSAETRYPQDIESRSKDDY